MTKVLTSSISTIAVLAVMLALAIPSLTLAAQTDKVDGFVCPVFNSDAAVGTHNPNAVMIGGGDYTILPAGGEGGHVSVPIGATNGEGAGSPGGSHSAPGDSDYTAIWNTSQ